PLGEETFYGLARVGLSTDTDVLARHPLSRIRSGLEEAVRNNFISQDVRPRIDQTLTQIARIAHERDVELRPEPLRIRGKVVWAETAEPLPDLSVRVCEPSVSPLGPSALTDRQGRFSVTFVPFPRKLTAEQRLAGADEFTRFELQFTVSDRDGRQVLETSQEVTRPPAAEVLLRVPATKPKARDSEHLTALAASLGATLPPDLLQVLDEHHVASLADV